MALLDGCSSYGNRSFSSLLVFRIPVFQVLWIRIARFVRFVRARDYWAVTNLYLCAKLMIPTFVCVFCKIYSHSINDAVWIIYPFNDCLFLSIAEVKRSFFPRFVVCYITSYRIGNCSISRVFINLNQISVAARITGKDQFFMWSKKKIMIWFPYKKSDT